LVAITWSVGRQGNSLGRAGKSFDQEDFILFYFFRNGMALEAGADACSIFASIVKKSISALRFRCPGPGVNVIIP
jgi:hypothetical protein